ncbi:hypothetical protein ACQHGV_07680 [Sphingomonas pseudosanguinis]|uniref:hypothetical protein n=1 Tax=Sphingomonas pseudosanguinis TaxID=413712 RepID=UPI003F8754CF
MDTPTFSVERIAPNLAKQMLERVFSSAKVDTSSRESFARDMAAGGWVLNGAPIVFGTDGSLLDGRARLHACIDSGATFETLVIRGIANDTFESIDAIRKRTLADILSIRQEQHGRPLGAALRILWSYGLGNGPGGKSPSPTALLALLEQKPQIRDSVMPALRAVPLLPHGCAIALHHLASAINPVKATLFLTQLQEPTIEAPNHPVVQLRQVLLQMRSQGGTRKQAYMLAIAIKAWNAFEAGKPIKALRFGAGEKFPRVQSLDWGPLSQVEKNLPANAPAATITAKLNVRLVTITPDIAEKMLDGRAPNRSVSSAVLNKYARDMAAGRWRLNGQTIKISRDGRLIDGQHRLEAAKKAKTSFPAIIVEGLENDVISTLDIGRRRAMSDVLRERGESNTIVFASALRWLWMLENNVVLAANSSPSSGELLDLLDRRPSIRNSLKQISTIREIMGGGMAAALHRTFADKDAERADHFFARLGDGVQLSSDSPILHLRERLLRTKSSNRARMAEAERVALCIKAWNTFRADRPMQLLVWRSRGAGREPLPTAA